MNLTTTELIWYAIGYGSQAVFGGRMFVQWWASERAGRTVVPLSFWYLSMLAATMMLSYACWQRDGVFVIGQALGMLVYIRNIVLYRGRESREQESAENAAPAQLSLGGHGCTCRCTCGQNADRKAA